MQGTTNWPPQVSCSLHEIWLLLVLSLETQTKASRRMVFKSILSRNKGMEYALCMEYYLASVQPYLPEDTDRQTLLIPKTVSD